MTAGIVIVWSGYAPLHRVIRAPCELGRDMFPDDDRMSRRHVSIEAHGNSIKVTDLGSRNGTFALGATLEGENTFGSGIVIRAGRTVGVLTTDVEACERTPHRAVATVREIFDLVATYRPVNIHATFVERALLSVWSPGFAAHVRKQLDEIPPLLSDMTLRAKWPERTAGDPKSFFEVFTTTMGCPPPFEIPADYKVLSKGSAGHERMIGSGTGTTQLVQADIGEVMEQPVGWYQFGFWGHGVNSYAVYYGRVTERSRVYLRMSYGAGAYEKYGAKAIAEALGYMMKYSGLAASLPCKHVTFIQSMEYADWRIEKLDGTVVEKVRERDEMFSHLEDYDFVAMLNG